MTINIINLIENTELAKLNGNYHSKIIEKIKYNFTNYEQHIFLSIFFCNLKYNPDKDFIIDMDNIWKWIGFSSKHKAKELLKKKFIENTDYSIFSGKNIVQPDTTIIIKEKNDNIENEKDTRGGHNKETIILTLNTFKKLCLKADTKKADEIHDYFIKLENILIEVIKEESEELKMQLLQVEETKNKEMQEKITEIEQVKNNQIKTISIKEKEKLLLAQYGYSGPLVYIIKVKTFPNGEYVIKIGESRVGVQDRYTEHRTNYEECVLLDCFPINCSRQFELHLHHHKSIRTNKYRELTGHTHENELFLIGKNLTYKMVLDIINDDIKRFKYTMNELINENEILQMKLERNQSQQQPDISTTSKINSETTSELFKIIKDLTTKIDTMSNKLDTLEKNNTEVTSKLNSMQTRTVDNFGQQLPHLGPRVQKINPETMQLVKVYESATELMNEDFNIKRPSLTKAVSENTVYNGFRWLFVERNADPNIIHNIQPTHNTQPQDLGYIAKIDAHQTEILNVYLDRKTSAKLNNYASPSALDLPVKSGKISKGHYYMLYEKCNPELIRKFQETHGEPLLYKAGVGQFNPNNELVREFSCKYDCLRALKMSDKTLAKALDNKTIYNGFYYKELGQKLSVI